MPASDIALLERWIGYRDAQAFADIVSRHSAMVYGTCRRILNDGAGAEDVTQECFLALTRLQRLKKGMGPSLGGWLHTLATYRSLDRLKAAKRRRLREDRFAAEFSRPVESDWDDIQSYVDEAIARLPEKLRQPVVSCFLEGKTHREVAKILGISRRTVTSRVAKGIDEVRKSLKKRGIPVSTSALVSLFTAATTEAAPAGLTASLGKLALAGNGGTVVSSGAALSAGRLALSITVGGAVMSTKKIAVLTAILAVIVCGLLLTFNSGEEKEVSFEKETQVASATEPIETETKPPAAQESALPEEQTSEVGALLAKKLRKAAAESPVPRDTVGKSETGALAEKVARKRNRDDRRGGRAGELGQIGGHVYDKNTGKPVSDAVVQLIQSLADSGGPRGKTKTGEDGSYSFDKVKPGKTYVIWAGHSEFATGESKPVSMDGVNNVSGVDVHLGSGHTIHGQLVTSTGEGVEGLTIELFASGGHPWAPIPFLKTKTGKDGDFTIMHVSPGAYQSSVNTAPLTKVIGSSFTMPGDSDLYDLIISIGAAAKGFISGKVTTREGDPLRWVEVVAYAANISGVAKTKKDGTYRINGLGGADSYGVGAKGVTGKGGYTRDQRKDVPVNSADIDFVLDKSGIVKGRATDSDTGKPIEKFSARWNQYVWREFNSSQGEFTLKGVEKENVTIEVRADGYVTTKTKQIKVPYGEIVEGIAIEMVRGDTLAGIVVDAESGQPLNGARVTTFEQELSWDDLRREHNWTNEDPFTDEEGRFELTGIKAGESANLVAWHREYAPGVLMRVSSESETETIIKMGRGGAVIGGTYEASQILADQSVKFYRSDYRVDSGDLFRYNTYCRTDGTGRFELDKLPPGPYSVYCILPSGRGTSGLTWFDRIEISEGTTTELPIWPEECGSLDVKVSGLPEGGTVDVCLTTPRWSGALSLVVSYTKSGAELPPLRKGDYTIGLMHDGDAQPRGSVPVTIRAGEKTALQLTYQ
ncbi:sigma-70 family RNA polymerase sigma factor [Candidatus Hydrogenedentota bacterium]